MRPRKRTREARGRRKHTIHLIEKAGNAATSPHPPARPGSARPGRALGGDRSGTPKARLAPARVARDTRPRRHNTHEAGEVTLSSVPVRGQMAGYG